MVIRSDYSIAMVLKQYKLDIRLAIELGIDIHASNMNKKISVMEWIVKYLAYHPISPVQR